MKNLLLLISLAFSMVINAQNDKTYKCHWHEEGVDDLNSPTAELRYSEKGNFSYLISNDNENIYLDLRIADRNVQQQVMMGGITVWINTDAKKRKITGLKYPVESKTADSLKLIGLSEEKEKIIFAGEKGNYRGSLNIQNNQAMYIKLILPLIKLKAISTDEKNKEMSVVLGISYNEAAQKKAVRTTTTVTKVVTVPSTPGESPLPPGSVGGRSGGSSKPSGSATPSPGSSYTSEMPVMIWMDPLSLAKGI